MSACLAGAVLACCLSPNPAIAGSISQVLDYRGHRALDGPYDIAADHTGAIYAAAQRNNAVLRITSEGIVARVLGPEGDGEGAELGLPWAVALGPDGSVYAVGAEYRNVFQVTSDGCITEIMRGGGSLGGPRSVAVDLMNNVFVCWTTNRVTKRTPDGLITDVLNASGDGMGHALNNPRSLDVDPDGTLYVAGRESSNVFRVTPEGAITQIIDDTGDGMGHPLSSAGDVAVDPLGNVFVIGGVSRNAFRIRPNGEITQVLDQFGAGGNTPQLYGPEGVATDSAGNVYVMDYYGVFKVTPSGEKSKIADLGFWNPQAITIDDDDNLYLSSMKLVEYDKDGFPCCPGSNIIYKIPPGGQPQLFFDGVGQAEVEKGLFEVPEFGSPYDVAIEPTGDILIASFSTGSAFRATPRGGIRRIIGPEGDGAGHFLDSAAGAAFDPAGNAYVSGYFSGNVFRITTYGVVSQIIDATGDGQGHPLNRPIHIASDRLGNVYVSGAESDNVLKWSADTGLSTQIIGPQGDGQGAILDAANRLVVDDELNVFVVGFKSHNVFRIAASGTITKLIDITGDGQGHALRGPSGLALGADGTVYVAGTETDNVFSITATGLIAQIMNAAGDGAGHPLNYPLGVALDWAGNVYVSGRDSQNVLKRAPDDTITEILNSLGDGRGSPFWSGGALGVDTLGRVYACGLSSDNVFRITPDVNISLGDFDGDQDADLHDFAAFQNCFGTRLALPDFCTRLDLNLDEKVNLADAGLFVSFVGPP